MYAVSIDEVLASRRRERTGRDEGRGAARPKPVEHLPGRVGLQRDDETQDDAAGRQQRSHSHMPARRWRHDRGERDEDRRCVVQLKPRWASAPVNCRAKAENRQRAAEHAGRATTARAAAGRSPTMRQPATAGSRNASDLGSEGTIRFPTPTASAGWHPVVIDRRQAQAKQALTSRETVVGLRSPDGHTDAVVGVPPTDRFTCSPREGRVRRGARYAATQSCPGSAAAFWPCAAAPPRLPVRSATGHGRARTARPQRRSEAMAAA